MATIMHCHSASLSHPPFLSASLTPLSRSSRRLPGGFYYNSSNLFGDANIRFSHPPNRTIKRRTHLTVVGLFGLGVPELVVIAGVAALVFGPKKLPEIGKSLGKTVKSFQQAANEFQEELSGAKESKASETMKAVDNSTTKEKERAEVPADD